jgi:hypothetical protein
MPKELNVHHLIFRQVAALLQATADNIAAVSGGDALEAEAYLWRLLATNSADKAELVEALAKGVRDETGKSDTCVEKPEVSELR